MQIQLRVVRSNQVRPHIKLGPFHSISLTSLSRKKQRSKRRCKNVLLISAVHPSEELRREDQLAETEERIDPEFKYLLKQGSHKSVISQLRDAAGFVAVVAALIGGGFAWPSNSYASRQSFQIGETINHLAENDQPDNQEEEETGKDKESSQTSKKKKREERIAARRESRRRTVKKGKKVDPYVSFAPNPEDIPDEESKEAQKVMSMWRLDKLKEVTYTQFWILVREGHIEKAKYSKDERSLLATLKPSAPGGARVCKIGLPYDPDLYNHLLRHDVFVERREETIFEAFLFMIIRLAIPIAVCYALLQVSFNIGKRQSSDDIFAGANLDMVHSRQVNTTFKDVAGIDQVKEELTEIISFLKNPKRFLELGAKSPAGILLVGPPGTGKTLLAKAIAGESRVPFFSTAGTEFSEMYVGVGASRVRDMFEKTRESAPCILFIDEFDAIGTQRSSEGTDESVHTLNQLLTEMDGFEDNTGVVVIGATNRPSALDSALTRPGRFDRIISLPLPNVDGRVEILLVHSRGKTISPDVDYNRVARATAGFTGAQLMNLMNQSAVTAVQQKRTSVIEEDIFLALEEMLTEKRDRGLTTKGYDEDILVPEMKKSIAIYESGKTLLGMMCPAFDEVYKVSVCPHGLPTGSTFFLPREERLESRVLTRGFMESKMVVSLAGRCAERLLLGDANISTAGAADLNLANATAKEMIYRCGFSKHLGPVPLMDSEDDYLAEMHNISPVANLSTDLARIAFEECRELMDAAEAKAYFGLVKNFEALEALIELLMKQEIVGLKELEAIATKYDLVEFKSPYLDGYGWDEEGKLLYPGDGRSMSETNGRFASIRRKQTVSWWDPVNPYSLRPDWEEIVRSSFLGVATEDLE